METRFVLKKIELNPVYGEHIRFLTHEGFVSVLLRDMRKDMVYFTGEQVEALQDENFLAQASGYTHYFEFEEAS